MDNRGYGFRSEYQTTLGRLGAFYRTWDDEEANTRIYSTFEALPRVFSGIISLPKSHANENPYLLRYRREL